MVTACGDSNVSEKLVRMMLRAYGSCYRSVRRDADQLVTQADVGAPSPTQSNENSLLPSARTPMCSRDAQRFPLSVQPVSSVATYASDTVPVNRYSGSELANPVER